MSNSDIHRMMQQQFELPTMKEWQEAAERSLKGKTIDSLKTETLEDITVQPLYTTFPNQTKRVRPSHRGWVIAQPVAGKTGSEWLASMTDSLEKGNEAIYIDGRDPIDWDEDSLENLAQLMVTVPISFIHIDSQDRLLQVFDKIAPENRSKVNGIVLLDESQLSSEYENIRTYGIDLESVHMSGADSVTELAISLAEAAQLAATSSSFQTFADKVFFRFPADTHFFMEIAKFRAFRTLWQLFCHAYDVTSPKPVPLVGFTSLRSFSKIDPYVNLLRGGNSAFSAVLGGADWLTVHPYNELTGVTAQSLRYARNAQLIIREETHADKVIDPAGGSYFIEQLTEELIHKAWQRFLEIEATGGKEAFLQSGQLQRLAEERKDQAAKGSASLIGTNVYADPASNTTAEDAFRIEADRPAYPFEELRRKAAGQSIDIALLVFGDLKSYKPRADFATGFVATGGLTVRYSPSFKDVGAAQNWLAVEKPDYAIICASPEMTEQIVPGLAMNKPEGLLLDVAGRVNEELTSEWMEKGIDGFLYNGQNRIDKLTRILDRCKGGVTHEEA